MAKVTRNPFPWPQIQSEENFKKPLALEGFEYDWHLRFSPWHRLYHHNTLASIRQNRILKHPHAPKDSLDFILNSVYDHCNFSFQEKSDTFRQPETVGLPAKKLLKNKRIVPAVRPARDLLPDTIPVMPEEPTCNVGTRFYGIKIGGVQEKRSPFSGKLGISSNHGYCTNGGYSRKVDGTFFSS